ncbi:MAG: hypothetical protein CR997_07925 [Acidobacteria bacterium]|nr:MAG: hypothetical protein CR997_07925 [Acidobacteriota bacterium]
MKYRLLLLLIIIPLFCANAIADGFVVHSKQILNGDGADVLSMNQTKLVRYQVYYDGSTNRPSGIGKFTLLPPECLTDEHVVITNLSGWQTIPVNSSSVVPIQVDFAVHVLNIPGSDFCNAGATSVCNGQEIFNFSLSLDIVGYEDPFECDPQSDQLNFLRNPGTSVILSDELSFYLGPQVFSAFTQAQNLTSVVAETLTSSDRVFLWLDWNASSPGSPWNNVSYFRYPISSECEVILAHQGSAYLTQYEGTVFIQDDGETIEVDQAVLGGAGSLEDEGAGINIFEVTDGELLGSGSCNGPLWSDFNYSSGGPYRMYFVSGQGFIVRSARLFRGTSISCDVASADDFFSAEVAAFDEAKLSLRVKDATDGMTYIQAELHTPSDFLKSGFEIDWVVEDNRGIRTSSLAEFTTTFNLTQSGEFSIATVDASDITVRANIRYGNGSELEALASVEAVFERPMELSNWALTEEVLNPGSNQELDFFFDQGEVISVDMAQADTGLYYHGYVSTQNSYVLMHGQMHKVFSESDFAGLANSSGIIGEGGYLGTLENDASLIGTPVIRLPKSNTLYMYELIKARPFNDFRDDEPLLLLFGFEKMEEGVLSLLYLKEEIAQAKFNQTAPSFLDHDFAYINRLDFQELTPKYSDNDPKVVPSTLIQEGSSNPTADPEGIYGWRWNAQMQRYECKLAPLSDRSSGIPVYYLYSDPIAYSQHLSIEIEQIRHFYANWNFGGSLEYRVINNQTPGPWLNINEDPDNLGNFDYNQFPFYDLGYAGQQNSLLSYYDEHVWTEPTSYGNDDPLTKEEVQFPACDQIELRIFAENPDEVAINSNFNWILNDWKILSKEVTATDNLFNVESRIVSSCDTAYLEFSDIDSISSIKWYNDIEAIYNDEFSTTDPINLLPSSNTQTGAFTDAFYVKVTNEEGTVRYMELHRSGEQLSWSEFHEFASEWREPEGTTLQSLIILLPSVCN